jgi:hypothetical protein
MKFKNNVLDKLAQLDATVNRVKIQVSRGIDQDQVLDSLEQLKEQIERLNEIISLEDNGFEQQFAPR